MTPLVIIALFNSLTETVATVAVIQTGGTVQVALAAFVIIFGVLNAGGFFAILWSRPYYLYSPKDYGGRIKPKELVMPYAGSLPARKHPNPKPNGDGETGRSQNQDMMNDSIRSILFMALIHKCSPVGSLVRRPPTAVCIHHSCSVDSVLCPVAS